MSGLDWRAIDMVLCDIDGVLTDGVLHYGSDGEVLKCFHSHDGHMIKVARRHGLRFGLVSGREHPAVRRRGDELGCHPQLLGIQDKLPVVDAYLQTCRRQWSQVAFIGDDLVDLPCLQAAGLSACPADANPLLRRRVDVVLQRPGGRGAIAEFLRRWLRYRQGQAPLADTDLHG